jgi:hypothetical protein
MTHVLEDPYCRPYMVFTVLFVPETLKLSTETLKMMSLVYFGALN